MQRADSATAADSGRRYKRRYADLQHGGTNGDLGRPAPTREDRASGGRPVRAASRSATRGAGDPRARHGDRRDDRRRRDADLPTDAPRPGRNTSDPRRSGRPRPRSVDRHRPGRDALERTRPVPGSVAPARRWGRGPPSGRVHGIAAARRVGIRPRAYNVAFGRLRVRSPRRFVDCALCVERG